MALAGLIGTHYYTLAASGETSSISEMQDDKKLLWCPVFLLTDVNLTHIQTLKLCNLFKMSF